MLLTPYKPDDLAEFLMGDYIEWDFDEELDVRSFLYDSERRAQCIDEVWGWLKNQLDFEQTVNGSDTVAAFNLRKAVAALSPENRSNFWVGEYRFNLGDAA